MDKIIAHLGIMPYADRFSQNFLLARWSVSYLLVYTWHTPPHYPHGANAGCDLAGVAPVGAPLFGSTLAPRRSIAFRNSAGTWSRAPGKQFGVLGRWRDRHTRPARWSDTLRIRPVRWRKWNRIRIDLARLADPIGTQNRSLETTHRPGAAILHCTGCV